MQNFTLPIRYSGQDFDEKQNRACEITEADRKAGRKAPEFGYSKDAFEQAEKEYEAACLHRNNGRGR